MADTSHDEGFRGLSLEVMQAREDALSIHVVEQVFNETILQKCAEHSYNRYLAPKIRPYTAAQTIALMEMPVGVSPPKQQY